jgi:hypothetical protein
MCFSTMKLVSLVVVTSGVLGYAKATDSRMKRIAAAETKGSDDVERSGGAEDSDHDESGEGVRLLEQHE